MTNNSPPPSEAPIQTTPLVKKFSLLLSAFLVLLTIELAVAGWFMWKTWYPPSAAVTLPQKQNILQENAEPKITTPLPTKAPDTGPGVYACDIQGVCNLFNDKRRAGCPVTYADPSCLNSCGIAKNQCPD